MMIAMHIVASNPARISHAHQSSKYRAKRDVVRFAGVVPLVGVLLDDTERLDAGLAGLVVDALTPAVAPPAHQSRTDISGPYLPFA
jgi:hypothetical protein